MSKRRKLSVMLFALVFVAHLCSASVGVREDGTRKGIATDINVIGPTVTRRGSVIDIDFSDKTANVDLDLVSWDDVIHIKDAGYTEDMDAVVIASPTYIRVTGGANYIAFPGTAGSGAAVVSGSQTGSPIEYSFMVPADYQTTAADTAAAFIIGCTNESVNDEKAGVGKI